MAKYPKTIYVQQEEDDGRPYLLAWKKPGEIDDDGKVAIYELKKVVTKSTKITLK